MKTPSPSTKLLIEAFDLMKEDVLYKIDNEFWNEIDNFYLSKGWTKLDRLEGFKRGKSNLVIYWNKTEIFRDLLNNAFPFSCALDAEALPFGLSPAFTLALLDKRLIDPEGSPLISSPKPKSYPLIEL